VTSEPKVNLNDKLGKVHGIGFDDVVRWNTPIGKSLSQRISNFIGNPILMTLVVSGAVAIDREYLILLAIKMEVIVPTGNVGRMLEE
jgi:hypothetical protein